MARNRKSESVAVRFGPAIKAAVICLLIGGSGVGYVWQKEQIIQLGKERKLREITLSNLENQNEKLRKQLGKMQSLPFVEAKIKELNLGLVPQQPAQVWRFPEPFADAPVPQPSTRQYPLQANGGPGGR